nr:conjugal transfer protein [uncultured bacterium]ACN38289.1 conjugal transfer protein [uncultured bacterium]
MECKQKLINASSLADNVSMNSFSFAVIVSRNLH